MRDNHAGRDLPLIAAACCAIAWAIARACLQSVTLDEADSYLAFAAADWPAHWYASSGNHVLNSILERIFTSLFGLSHLTLRAPALIGGAAYVAASYGLCVRISADRAVRWPLFVCLVYNPFVMDYMIAARGYGLALGFLVASVWAMMQSRFAAASICIGLSFCANFSFAYIDAAVMLLAAIWMAWRRNWHTVAHCLFPGAAVAFLICGSTVPTFPRSQLYYGASGLGEMWKSIVSAMFDDLNPFLVHPLLATCLAAAGRRLPVLMAALVIWQALRIVRAEQPLGVILARAIAVALLCHWLAFRLLRIPLPLARTAIFFVPLAMLLIGMGAALPPSSRIGALSRPVSIAVLSLCALYFVGCLRLSYFKEWKFDADVKDVYAVLRNVQDRFAIRGVGVNWRYSSPLNFYRECFHDRQIASFAWIDPLPPGRSAYVLSYPESERFIQEQKLNVIYRGKRSDVVIALRPEPSTGSVE